MKNHYRCRRSRTNKRKNKIERHNNSERKHNKRDNELENKTTNTWLNNKQKWYDTRPRLIIKSHKRNYFQKNKIKVRLNRIYKPMFDEDSSERIGYNFHKLNIFGEI